MSFPALNDETFKAILAANLTPSATIKTPELLFGRAKALTQIERALGSSGRQVFIYGDRGVGKTSLALTAANLLNSSGSAVIYAACSSQPESFAEVIGAIGNSVTGVETRFEVKGGSPTFGAMVAGFGGNYKPGDKARPSFGKLSSLNDALDVVRYVLAKQAGRIIVVVDEMERISSSSERDKFAEFIKNVPEIDDRIKFVFCGIGSTVDQLIGAHPSAGRILEPIHLERLHHNYLWDIIENVAEKIGVTVDREALVRIGQISDGFPHYVHLIGESMFWSAFDDERAVIRIGGAHFKAGIKGALARAEAVLRLQYEKATMKTKNTEDYEETLWSMADTTSDRRQITEIFESSYKRIMLKRRGRPLLPRDKFNQRLLSLRSEGHGSILIGFGSGWFGFRENILRGYVRLRAESGGIELGRDQVMAA